MSAKPNAIAIVNSGIESRQNPRKRILSDDSDEIRKRNKINETLVDSTSGESSDSDSTIDSEDEIVTTNKRKRIRDPDSSDEEPPAKVSRKKKFTKNVNEHLIKVIMNSRKEKNAKRSLLTVTKIRAMQKSTCTCQILTTKILQRFQNMNRLQDGSQEHISMT